MYSIRESDKIDIASYLLDNGAALETRSKAGMTALAYAVQHDRLQLVNFLINRKLDVFTFGIDNLNLLQLAARSSVPKLFLLLLSNGVNPHQKASLGDSPVHAGICLGSSHVQSLLLNSPSLLSNISARPFNILAIRDFGEKKAPVVYRVLRRLSQPQRQEMIHQAGIRFCNPLCEQTKAGNIKATEILLHMRGDIETECPTHGTPAMVASNYGRFDILNCLSSDGPV